MSVSLDHGRPFRDQIPAGLHRLAVGFAFLVLELLDKVVLFRVGQL